MSPVNLSAVAVIGEQGQEHQSTSWLPAQLDEILSGDYAPIRPTMLARTDGRYLVYPGRIHAWNAEPEALKTWLLLKLCREQMLAGEHVLFIDFEDSAVSVVHRLLELGVPANSIRDTFHYIRPDEPLSEISIPDLDRALNANPSVAVIDGVTEAFSIQGLSPLDNADVARWLDLLPRRIARTGAAVNLLDHVVKDREQRGRYAIGPQHKLAGVDVSYSMRVIEPFGRGRDGVVSIKVVKDRPGSIREFAIDSQVAVLHAQSLPDGAVSIRLDPPEQANAGFRPTVLMERVSVALEAGSGLSKRAIRQTVSGKAAVIDLALELLISEGYVDPRPDGQAIRHHSIRPYREAEDTNRVPVSQPCPNRVRDTVDMTVSPCPALKGTRNRTRLERTQNEHDRVPDRSASDNDTGDDLDAIIARHRDNPETT